MPTAAPPLQPGKISPRRPVPAFIPRPEYVGAEYPTRSGESDVKPPEMLAKMRVAGRIAADALVEAGRAVRPGITTDELDLNAAFVSYALTGYDGWVSCAGFVGPNVRVGGVRWPRWVGSVSSAASRARSRRALALALALAALPQAAFSARAVCPRSDRMRLKRLVARGFKS